MLDQNIDNNNLAVGREPGFLSRSANYAIAKVKNNIWIVGIPTWLFGVYDRGMAVFIDGHLTALKLSQLFITCFFFISWLYLKPDSSLGDNGVSAIDKLKHCVFCSDVGVIFTSHHCSSSEVYHFFRSRDKFYRSPINFCFPKSTQKSDRVACCFSNISPSYLIKERSRSLFGAQTIAKSFVFPSTNDVLL